MDRDEELRRRRGEHTRSYSQDRPIGSGDNAKAIVRGVKQWLPDIPGAVGDLADMLYAGGANVLQGQKRRSIAPLGAGPAIRRAIAKKSPLEQVEMRATPETDWVEEGVRFANPAMFMSPKNIATMGGLALAGGVPGAAMAVVKPRGGNWYTGSGSEMESAIKGLLKGQNGRGVSIEGLVLNKWLEGPLQRYVKRDMATEADPIRKLLEQDPPISHMLPRELDAAANENWLARRALDNRFVAGLPRAGSARSRPARAWETISDGMLTSNPASLIQKDSWMPPEHPMQADWVKKLHPDEPIYDFGYGDEASSVLGLDHLRDELWNAVRAGSDLPENLRLKPEDFQQMGIEKAVRHVADINNWRANAKAAASRDMLSGPGVKLIREYPENNPKGLRWVELQRPEQHIPEGYEYDARTGTYFDPWSEGTQPLRLDREYGRSDLQKQLKYEGDTMGHCVGGYCDDVLSGNTKIFSLRDAKGEPHVTIEMLPPADQKLVSKAKEAERVFTEETGLPFDPVENDDFMEWALSDGYERYGDVLATNISPGYSIKQIKGKQNLAPKEDYLPFIKDFLANPYHGSTWGEDIGDLDTLGLSPEDLAKIPRGYAQGGLVGKQDFNGVVGYILD